MVEQDDDATLPKATIQKLLTEIVPKEYTLAKDCREMLIECCVEFVKLISSEANEICEKEDRKTIAPEHIVRALSHLGFPEFVDGVMEATTEHRSIQKLREQRHTKFDRSGMTQEELLRMQEELLQNARQKFNSQSGPSSQATGSSTNSGNMMQLLQQEPQRQEQQ